MDKTATRNEYVALKFLMLPVSFLHIQIHILMVHVLQKQEHVLMAVFLEATETPLVAQGVLVLHGEMFRADTQTQHTQQEVFLLEVVVPF